MTDSRVGILGGGLTGCCTALALAKRGIRVDLLDGAPQLLQGASLHNEGKLHLGYVYAADRDSKTHTLMAFGSLNFLRILRELTGAPLELFRRSMPFIYGIPEDSLLSVEEISRHFSSVDRAIGDIYHESPELVEGERIPSITPLSAQRIEEIFCREAIIGAFQTGEYSLDTDQVADVITRCVKAHPNIVVRTNTSVVMAEKTVSGNFAIHTCYGAERRVYRYPFVVNCLWGDRIRVDQGVGVLPSRPWLMRYKAAITLRRAIDDRFLKSLPSTTFILGPYGDVVNHGNGKVYISWYPVCKLAETSTNTCNSLFEAAATADQDLLVHQSLQALSRYIPCLENIRKHSYSVEVNGGVICAWGSTDITDIGSGLHQRYRIGPSIHDNWISVDTGKYCMAPLFGVQAAESLESRIRGGA
jgi:hypothetical protein